jgi:RND superfamily putative drug exporter
LASPTTKIHRVIGRFAYRHRWWVLGFWVVVLVAGIALSGPLFGRLRTVDGLRADAESARADRLVQDLISDGPIVFAVVGGLDDVYGPGIVKSVSATSEAIRHLTGVVDVDDLYTSPGGQIGADNHSTLVKVELAENLSDNELEAVEDEVRAKLETIEAPSVLIGGDKLTERAFGEQAVRDLAVGESIAFALLIVALIIVFGGVVAAAIPLVVAIVGVAGTLLVLLGVSLVTDVGDYSLNIVTLLGLGLAVDYALLIVARYREERAAGEPAEAAVVTAMTRAGRAVAISGVAVAAALAGLTFFAEPLLASMALGGVAVVLLTTALALTAVPALIAVVGGRIPAAGAETWVTRAIATARAKLPGRRTDAAADKARGAARRGRGATPTLLVRLAALAQRNPGPVAAATTLGLLLLAAPLLGASFANSDARSLPASLMERRAYDAYQSMFASNQAAPVTVVATVDAASPELRDYLNTLNRLPGVTRLSLRPDVPTGSVIVDLTPEGATAGERSRALVRSIRADRPAFPVLVTGEAAKVVDYQDSVAGRLPAAVVVVVVAMLVLLFLLTRSVVIPLKAILLNALTFVATLGVLVALFQWGWGGPVLRFEPWGALDLTTPLLLFVFIFGLTMDYEVFLLSRIAEEYAERRDNDSAVLAGIGRSGPVVTAAAVCITIVFLGFAAGGLVAVKEIGVGMAVAVVLDVTVVRGLLLPAAMSLLGDLNWWSPGFLRPTPRGRRAVGGRRATVGK